MLSMQELMTESVADCHRTANQARGGARGGLAGAAVLCQKNGW